MSRAPAFAFILICWAAIYLPGLGSLEIKGEEGRRILPAVTMLDTGNYLVPQVGSEPYFNKPPLVNWVVAASFNLTGVRNEWTARLPSVLCVLAVALAFLTVARRPLGANGSAFAAIIWLANFGIVEKGRLIEIEALYVSLFALALICWLSWWREGRSSWLTWTVPWIFLGLGLLAKGPLHLLFFYSAVVAVLYSNAQLRKLLTTSHLAGLLIMTGIFAAWAIPYWAAMRGADVAGNWTMQLSGRLAGDDFKLRSWLLNIPRGLAYFLPWTLLLPLALKARWVTDDDRRLARALLWGAAVPFVIVNLLPGGLPRYSMPALVPACWLMAMTFSAPEIKVWKGALTTRWRFSFVVQVAVYAGLLLLAYGLWLVPLLQSRSKVKPIASRIDQLVPNSEPLYALDPDFQPFLFYVKSRLIYIHRLDEVPATARYLLIQPEMEKAVMESSRWSPLRAQPIERFTDYRRRTTILAKVAE
ncbi:MAG TPA: glycosyltransferase family 39 protein [Chthoniobacterales bacterium]|jgi:4-amino-4-deoxy-L-arabinose transferase-like glycosyltransferase|nr:glycosyltransferase family 39 protein [Chthoniobacterales bacterium]